MHILIGAIEGVTSLGNPGRTGRAILISVVQKLGLSVFVELFWP
jgi:hypothetical protein